MEHEYWSRFLKTGQVTDYLYYKGLSICKEVMERHESNYIDRNGVASDANGRI